MRRMLILASLCFLLSGLAAGQLTPPGQEKPILVLDAEGHSDVVKHVMFTPSGKFAITVGHDKCIRIWDLARVEKLHGRHDVHVEDIQLVGHQGSVTTLIQDTSAGTIISGSYDTTIRVWSLKPGAPRTTNAEEGTVR